MFRTAAIHPLLLQWLQAPAEQARLPLPETPSAWEPILRDARRHCLIPLLYRDLTRHPDRRVPEPVLAGLKRSASGIAATNLLLTSELVRLLQTCEGRGIPCVPLRGVALSESLHGDVTARPTGDVDVLVRREDLARVRAAAGELGFYEAEPRPGFSAEFSYTLELFKDHLQPIVAEPHWSIAYPPYGERMPMPAVWERCREGVVAGVHTRALSPEDLLIHLSLHLLHHGDSAPLLWTYELDRLIRRAPLDWPLLCTIAQEARLEPLLHPVLTHTQRLFQTPIPGTILERLNRMPTTPQERRIVSLLISTPSVKGREYLATLLSLHGIPAKARFALAFLFPSREFVRVQYGASSWWDVNLRYVRRVCDLGWTGLRGLLRAVRARLSGSPARRSPSGVEASRQNRQAPGAMPAPQTESAPGTLP